jgi:hypothetical protein
MPNSLRPEQHCTEVPWLQASFDGVCLVLQTEAGQPRMQPLQSRNDR